jgi:methionyl-tRNA formyltransferase
MNVILLCYREWAKNALLQVSKNSKIKSHVFCNTHEDLLKIKLQEYDLLISLGWSDELGQEVCEKICCIGLHCAELDRYSYGSPIQLQIIDGVKKTKHRVFPFVFDNESKRAHTHTREFSHEIDLSLEGGIADVFEELTKTSVILLNNFINDFPDISWRQWPEEKEIRKKREPRDSRIDFNDFETMELEKIYDFIRCLEDPYPNAYLEDDNGKLFFKKVVYKKV